MSYEKFKGLVLNRLIETPNIPSETVKTMLTIMDSVAVDFDIKEMTKALSLIAEGLPEIAKIYLAAKKIEGLAEGTLYNKLRTLTHFHEAVSKPIDQITSNDIRVYLYNYQAENNIENCSLDKIRMTISTYFAWLTNEGYLAKNPAKTINPIKTEEKQRQSLSQMEMEYVRRACRTIREKAIVEFLYSTGCRVSEAAIVKISDVDFLTDEVHLFGKGKKHRTSYLNAKAHVALEDYLKTRKDNSPYLFVTTKRPYRSLTKDAIEEIVQKIAARTGLNKPLSPHIFRHTMATQAVRHGMAVEEVQKLLGHKNIATTMVYVETNESDVRISHKKAVV